MKHNNPLNKHSLDVLETLAGSSGGDDAHQELKRRRGVLAQQVEDLDRIIERAAHRRRLAQVERLRSKYKDRLHVSGE